MLLECVAQDGVKWANRCPQGVLAGMQGKALSAALQLLAASLATAQDQEQRDSSHPTNYCVTQQVRSVHMKFKLVS